MSKYDLLTKYIYLFTEDVYGEWVFPPKKEDATATPAPYFKYKPIIYAFITDVNHFMNEQTEMDLQNYKRTMQILRECGIDSHQKIVAALPVLDAKAVSSIIVSIVRTDRFSEGLLGSTLADGSIIKMLQRLHELE